MTITNYTGNAGLGSGSSPDIPVNSVKDLDTINQTARDIYLNSTARNQQLFQQKLRDRDKLLLAIDSGDIKVGDLLDQDAPFVKEGLEKLDQAFENRVKKGINDLDAAREYKKALRDAQDRVTQAQGRKLFYDAESGEIGKETLPRKQEARKKNLEGVIKGGFWKDIQPYQQTQDLDINGSILSTAANVTSEFTDPKTFTKGKRTEFDYGKTLDANVNNFLSDANKRYDQEQLVREIQELDPSTFGKTMESMNARIVEYNKGKNLQPTSPGYVEPIKYDVIDGRGVVAEKMPDFAAKYTLANQKPFGQTETLFDKDRAAFALGQQRNQIAQQNANANTTRARTYAQVQQKKLSELDADEKRVKNFWGDIVGNIKRSTFAKKDASGKYEGVAGDYVFTSDIPTGYQNIAGLDIDGKPIPLIPKNIGGKKGYETRYKTKDGGQLEKDFLMNKFQEYKGAGGKGDYNVYVKSLVNQGVVDMELIGQNGTANFETAFQTARALSNKVGSGKEEPVFSETTTTETEEE